MHGACPCVPSRPKCRELPASILTAASLPQCDGMDVLAVRQAFAYAKEYAVANGERLFNLWIKLSALHRHFEGAGLCMLLHGMHSSARSVACTRVPCPACRLLPPCRTHLQNGLPLLLAGPIVLCWLVRAAAARTPFRDACTSWLTPASCCLQAPLCWRWTRTGTTATPCPTPAPPTGERWGLEGGGCLWEAGWLMWKAGRATGECLGWQGGD